MHQNYILCERVMLKRRSISFGLKFWMLQRDLLQRKAMSQTIKIVVLLVTFDGFSPKNHLLGQKLRFDPIRHRHRLYFCCLSDPMPGRVEQHDVKWIGPLYRVFQNAAPPSRAQVAQPWVKSMIVQWSKSDLKLICQASRNENHFSVFYRVFPVFNRLPFC